MSTLVPDIRGFIGGVIGSCCSVVVGQPFDIVKVRLQNSAVKTSAGEVIKSIYQKEGLLAFWKGTLPPLVGIGFANSIVFGVVENSKKVVSSFNEPEEVLSIKQHAFCGAVSGTANSLASTPAEGLRIRMQVQGKVDPRGDPHYTNSVDCAKKVFEGYGIKGIYRGFASTLVRDTLGCGMFFFVYQGLAKKVFVGEAKNAEDMKSWQVFIAGGLGGMAFWCPIYPIDSIKSRLQADSLTNPRYRGSLDCLYKTLQEVGLSGMYKGFWPCAARSFPANASMLVGFELAMSIIGRDYS